MILQNGEVPNKETYDLALIPWVSHLFQLETQSWVSYVKVKWNNWLSGHFVDYETLWNFTSHIFIITNKVNKNSIANA